MSDLTIKDLTDTEILDQGVMQDLHGGRTFNPYKISQPQAQWSWDLSTVDATRLGDASTTVLK